MSKPRRNNGQYDHGNLNLVCECGHKLAVHAAVNNTKQRPCFNEDKGIEGSTGENCNCKNFKKHG